MKNALQRPGMICPICQEIYPTYAEFCPHHGTKLSPFDPTNIVLSTESEIRASVQMVCPLCQSIFDNDARYCPQDSQKLIPRVNQHNIIPQKEPKNALKFIIPIFAILSCIVILSALYYYYVTERDYIKVKNAYKTGNSMEIGSQINARINRIHVRVGDTVKPGDILISQDADELKRSLAILDDELKELQHVLQEKQILYDIFKKTAEFQKKKIDLLTKIKKKNIQKFSRLSKNARQAYKANKEVFDKGMLSNLEFKSSEDQFTTISNRYDVQLLEMEILKEIDEKATQDGFVFDGDRVLMTEKEILSQIQTIKEKIKLQENKIERGNADVKKGWIRAPFQGVVDEILVNPGEVTQLGDPLIILNLPGQEWLQAYVNETEISGVQIGADVRINFKAHPAKTFKGKVNYIGQVVNSENISKSELKIIDDSPGFTSEVNRYVKIIVMFNSQGVEFPNGISATILIQESPS